MGNTRRERSQGCEQRRPSRDARTSARMSLYGNIRGATAKFLSTCKAVSSRNFTQLIKLQLEEPLELVSNGEPRYIAAHAERQDRIRLISAAK